MPSWSLPPSRRSSAGTVADVDPDAALAALDAKVQQTNARRREFARSVAAYYTTLTDEGVPETLAASLTENFHDHHWEFVFGTVRSDE